MSKAVQIIFVGLFVITYFVTSLNSKVRHVYDIPPVNFSLADAIKTDVTYQLFTNQSTSGIYIEENSTHLIDLGKPTKFLIHGWLSNETTYWYAPYRDECFKKGDYNIIYIDWSKAGAKDFFISAANSKPIGHFIGDFILAADLALENVHIIGHSLGSHVAGFIGKRIFHRTSKKIGRITCTDPAGPGFEHDDVDNDGRVDRSDAQFVDVTHTDIGHFGFIKPIGHVDFYPNGGTHQPGCPSYEVDDNCSHARSNWYFIESVNSDGFQAIPCKSWEDSVNGDCTAEDPSENIVFGENVPLNANGIYYFATNSEPPFALGRSILH